MYFKLIEQGCIDKEEAKNSVFILKEESQDYLNYFSEELKSNLIIKRNSDLYYYPHLKPNYISPFKISILSLHFISIIH